MLIHEHAPYEGVFQNTDAKDVLSNTDYNNVEVEDDIVQINSFCLFLFLHIYSFHHESHHGCKATF